MSDTETSGTEQGLHAKYEVKKDGKPVTDCFVLEPENDAAARLAIKEYAAKTENESLAEDLREWLREYETVVPHRTNPREVLDPVVDLVEFIEPGVWRVQASGAVYRDVMVGGLYMEGYRVGGIEHVSGDTFRFEVVENYGLEDEKRYLDTGNSHQ